MGANQEKKKKKRKKGLPYLPEVAQEAEGEPAESVVMEAEVGELQGSKLPSVSDT